MAMGNTTVDPRNTAYVCGSVITIDNERLKEGKNGPLYVAQGNNLEISVSDSAGFKINEFGEIIRPDGTKTDSVMSKQEVEKYKNYRKKINQAKQIRGNDR